MTGEFRQKSVTCGVAERKGSWGRIANLVPPIVRAKAGEEPTKAAIDRFQPIGQGSAQLGSRQFADVDLVERLQLHVCLRITVQEDRFQIDDENLRPASERNVAAYHVNVLYIRRRVQAAASANKTHDGLRSLIGHCL